MGRQGSGEAQSFKDSGYWFHPGQGQGLRDGTPIPHDVPLSKEEEEEEVRADSKTYLKPQQ